MKKLLSVIVSCYNEEEALPLFYKEINKISCSAETDSICQINEKYLCIGLQDYDLQEQQSGFALVNIITGKVDVIKDDQINCIYYDKENSLLMASMEIIKKRNFSMMIKIILCVYPNHIR